MQKRQYRLTPQQHKEYRALKKGQASQEVFKFWSALGAARHFDFRTVTKVYEDGTFYALPKV